MERNQIELLLEKLPEPIKNRFKDQVVSNEDECVAFEQAVKIEILRQDVLYRYDAMTEFVAASMESHLHQIFFPASGDRFLFHLQLVLNCQALTLVEMTKIHDAFFPQKIKFRN